MSDVTITVDFGALPSAKRLRRLEWFLVVWSLVFGSFAWACLVIDFGLEWIHATGLAVHVFILTDTIKNMRASRSVSA